jgi:hypothetical protein
MKILFRWPVLALVFGQFVPTTEAFISVRNTKSSIQFQFSSVLSVAAVPQDVTDKVTATEGGERDNNLNTHRELTQFIISTLPYRELIHELSFRGQVTAGTTSQLRSRLRQVALPGQEEECVVNEDDMDDDCVTTVRWI